jgi:hypothetical protein
LRHRKVNAVSSRKRRLKGRGAPGVASSNFGLGVFKLRSQSVDTPSELGAEASAERFGWWAKRSCGGNRKSKVQREGTMVKNARSKDVEQMSLLELATLQANIMDWIMAGKITPQEADVISDTAEKRMRSLKRELGAH